MCDQGFHIPESVARKAWEWVLDELPEYRSCSLLGGISGPELAVLRQRGLYAEMALTYQLELIPEIDILKIFSAKRRNIIKRESKRLHIKNGAPIDEFLFYLRKSYIRKGIKLNDITFLKKRMDWAISENTGSIISAYTEEGKFSSGIFCLWDQTFCHYMFGCTNIDLPKPEGNSLCLYEAMRQRQGFTKSFNFEGSVLPGVEPFIRSFCPKSIMLVAARKTLWTTSARYLPFLRRFIL